MNTKRTRMKLLSKLIIEIHIFIFRKTRGTPRSFNQKIKYKAAFDRRDVLTTFADKIAVREYVADAVGENYLNTLYFKTDNPHEINWELIPKEFVIKANHCSGGSVIVWQGALNNNFLPKNNKNIYWNRYQVTPDNLVREDLVNLANAWLNRNYTYSFPSRRIPEWAYLNINPQVLFEELLLENKNSIAKDYKFQMYNGKCEFINVVERNKFDSGKEAKKFSSIFDRHWKKLNFSLNDGVPSPVLPEKPDNLDEMLEVATKLAKNIDYVRVDLYNINKRIIFGELTNYPQSGRNTYHFEPFAIPNRKKSRDLDRQLGAKLVLDNYELIKV